MVLSSGGGLGEGDGESECRELSDVAASSAVGVGAARVVVRAEILIAGGWVGQELPDDDQDGPGDGDEGLELAAAFDDAPVAFAEEGVGAGGRGGGLAQDTFQVGVSLTGAPAAAGGPGLDGARAELGPRHQVTGGGEPAHVQADLGDDGLGALPTDTGDLVQAIDGGQHRGVRAPAGARTGGAVGVGALGGGRWLRSGPRCGWTADRSAR